MKKLLLLISVLSFIACTPETKPEMQSKINRIYSKRHNRIYRNGGRFFRPRRLRVGQYIMQAVIHDGQKTITKTSIVGRRNGGYIIETYSINGYGESTSQMLVKGIEKARRTGKTDGIEIVWVKVKDENGEVNKINGAQLLFTKKIYKRALSGIELKISRNLWGGRVRVPAGLFFKTVKNHSSVKILGKKYKSSTWYNYNVPINGIVKSVSDDKSTIVELLNFGLYGARSQM